MTLSAEPNDTEGISPPAHWGPPRTWRIKSRRKSRHCRAPFVICSDPRPDWVRLRKTRIGWNRAEYKRKRRDGLCVIHGCQEVARVALCPDHIEVQRLKRESGSENS